MKKRHKLVSLVFVLIIIGIIAVKHFHIEGFRAVKEGVLYVSSQPKGMDYARLMYKFRIKTIVNVCLESESKFYEEELVKTKMLGIRYVPIPIEQSRTFPNELEQKQFLKIMSEKQNRPVLLHGHNIDVRAAMLAAVWLRCAEGYDSSKAAKAAEALINRPLHDSEIKFIEQLPADKSAIAAAQPQH